MHKIETHLHTRITSKCGKMTPEDLVAGYVAAGYSAICVSDHFNRITFDYLGVDLKSGEDKVARFLEGYYRVKEEGLKQGLMVYKSAELRFDECDNDYLLYGWQDDLLSDPEAIFKMGVAEFSKLSKAAGAVLVQAHPYRGGCTPAFACYLDGIEILNTNPRHNSNDARAVEYAERHGLFGIGGSDCHRPEDLGRCGILTEKLPDQDMSFARLLKSRKYQIIGRDE